MCDVMGRLNLLSSRSSLICYLCLPPSLPLIVCHVYLRNSPFSTINWILQKTKKRHQIDNKKILLFNIHNMVQIIFEFHKKGCRFAPQGQFDKYNLLLPKILPDAPIPKIAAQKLC